MRNRVVLVEDDDAVRSAVIFSLELYGLRVDAFRSVQSALAYSGLRDAACLVVEHKMPGMDGFALYRRLAEEGHCPPVIMITAVVTKELQDQANALGLVAILEKPLLDNVLERNVWAAISR